MASLILRSVGVSLLALASLSAGCGDERAALLVRGVSMGTLDTTTGTCKYENSPTQSFDGLGVVYSSYLTYDRVLLIRNQLTPSRNPQEYRPETNTIVLKDAEVTVRAPNGSVISKFRVAVSGSVDPGDQTAVVRVTLLDTVAMKALVDSKVADASISVKLNGQTNASISVTSGDLFSFPVRTAVYSGPPRDAGVASVDTDASSDAAAPITSDATAASMAPQGPGCI